MALPSIHDRNLVQHSPANQSGSTRNLLVFSHLRWDFVYQRPQHLLTRFAKEFNVLFLEEPVFEETENDYYTFSKRAEKATVIVPHLPHGLSAAEITKRQIALLDNFMRDKALLDFVFWYYTPMALAFSRQYKPEVIIFDCMDELSAFKYAPDALKVLEKELLSVADVVFTGGNSLYEAKKQQHTNIHSFPSSIDSEHFLKARKLRAALDRPSNPSVKLGFFGVIDERFDIDLIKDIADKRPLWNVELVGPVVKIDPASLPVRSNINYVGPRSYEELPAYLSTWNIALIPFLLNESTRFISPTKTPEYLSGGLPVISTAIKDVVDPYGIEGLVHIAVNADEFIVAIEKELQLSTENKSKALANADAFLATNSWDLTCARMLDHVYAVLKTKSSTALKKFYV